jgi:1-acyl-sn-glycerol-3-phosphate acyltransferase
MNYTYRVVNFTIKWLTEILCQVEHKQLDKIPLCGPLILVSNHINFLDVPVLYTRLQPRPITGFAKLETWKNPALGYLADIWGAIPIRRGELDLNAMRKALGALEAGEILGLSPEGTRSGDGCLQRGHPGVVSLALRSGAPIMPFGFYGGEMFRENLNRFQRTNFKIVVGNLFCIKDLGRQITSSVRQEITDEIMYQVSALLPPKYRGYYSNLSAAKENYLIFPKNSRSNLSYGTGKSDG